MDSGNVPDMVRRTVERLGDLPEVKAIALGGSSAIGNADNLSDLDLYVYGAAAPPLAIRAELARAYDPEPELDNQAFGLGDEWEDAATGLAVDLIYWTPDWIEAQLTRVLDDHLPSVGYTTSFWRTIAHSIPLVDPTSWFAVLQEKSRRPYPEPLRLAIIQLNYPLLRDARSSFLHQIERAIGRNDAVSVQHRTTALLASYFDVLFAFNRVLHPGEKRLLAIARRECAVLPEGFERTVGELIAAVPPPWDDGRLIALVHALIDELDKVLAGDTIGSQERCG